MSQFTTVVLKVHFTEKIVVELSKKNGFGIRDPEKIYPGSRGQEGTGSATLLVNGTVYLW
jgi:hypothetical protein